MVINKRLLHYFPRDNNREDFLFFREGAERYVRLIVGKMREPVLVRLDRREDPPPAPARTPPVKMPPAETR